MSEHRIFKMTWKSIYGAYVSKVTRKNQSKEDLHDILIWLTGYGLAELENVSSSDVSLKDFILNAPLLNDNRHLITGSICGVKIQEIEDPMMKEVRYMDKLVDELAKGKALEKIKRG